MGIPADFQDLATASSAAQGSLASVIGMVVDIMPPTTTAKGQHMLTFKLLDTQLHASLEGYQGLSVRFFKHDAGELPKVRSNGDVVLLRDVKVQPFRMLPMLISTFQTGLLVFPSTSIPDPTFELSFLGNNRVPCFGTQLDKQKLSLEEQRYVIDLRKDLAHVLQSLPSLSQDPYEKPTLPSDLAVSNASNQARSLPIASNQKLQLIKDLRHRVFADLYAQVVKKFPNSRGFCELYVTDYTENKSLFSYRDPEEHPDLDRDGDEYGYTGPVKRTWPGPYGQLVLKVNIMPPHASFALREVDEGDFVMLKNMKMKYRQDVSKLEGDLWPDDLNYSKILISKVKACDSPSIQTLVERKDAYWAVRKQATGDPEANQPPKKMRKRNKKKASKAPQPENARDENPPELPTKKDINPHIRCSHQDIKPTSIRTILDPEDVYHTNTRPGGGADYTLPFINAKYRAKVRVVDFSPPNLADFASHKPLIGHHINGNKHGGNDDDDATSDISMDMGPDSAESAYEWSFSLLLEDAMGKTSSPVGSERSRLWVNLGHEEAQFLLGKEVDDPRDLRRDPRLLAKLREKMCIVWGDLEEKGSGSEQQVSNLPFHCCLMEYGIEMDDGDPEKKEALFGYRRLYRMFGVTVV